MPRYGTSSFSFRMVEAVLQLELLDPIRGDSSYNGNLEI